MGVWPETNYNSDWREKVKLASRFSDVLMYRTHTTNLTVYPASSQAMSRFHVPRRYCPALFRSNRVSSLAAPGPEVRLLCLQTMYLELYFSDRSQREKALRIDTRTGSGKEVKHSVRSWSNSDHTHTPFSLRMHRPYLAIKRSIKLGTRKG